MIKTFVINLIEDICLWLKNRTASSRYIIKGKCRQCGQCCSNIMFCDENGYIKSEEAFYQLQKTNRRYRHFFINGKLEDKYNEFNNGALLFKCKSLKENGKCGRYFFRSIACRDYPSINPYFIQTGGTTLDGCGYSFDVDKKFKDYL